MAFAPLQYLSFPPLPIWEVMEWVLTPKAICNPENIHNMKETCEALKGILLLLIAQGLKGNFPLLMYWSPKILPTVNSFISNVGHCFPITYIWHLLFICYMLCWLLPSWEGLKSMATIQASGETNERQQIMHKCKACVVYQRLRGAPTF